MCASQPEAPNLINLRAIDVCLVAAEPVCGNLNNGGVEVLLGIKRGENRTLLIIKLAHHGVNAVGNPYVLLEHLS